VAGLLHFVDLPDHVDQALGDSITTAWTQVNPKVAITRSGPNSHSDILARARFRPQMVPLSAFSGQFPRNAAFYAECDDDPDRADMVSMLAARYKRGLPVPPVVVSCAGGRWRILDGQHRLTAAYVAKRPSVAVHRLVSFA
jgi:hypothetical protein